MSLRWQAVLMGAALMIATGIICILFPGAVLWAPGMFVAFVINGGGHEAHLSNGWFWTIAAAVNFAAYASLSWISIAAFKRIRAAK